MYEQHQAEQYFFDNATIETLANWVAGFENPCCLCTPMIGKRLESLGVNVTTLDSDDRLPRSKATNPTISFGLTTCHSASALSCAIRHSFACRCHSYLPRFAC